MVRCNVHALPWRRPKKKGNKMNPDLLEVISDPELHTDLELTDEQKQLSAVIKHHYVLQDQFNQLTQHVERIYGLIKDINKVLANKVLS